MCGIAGILDFNNVLSFETIQSSINKMIDPLIHRGPDDQGCWVDAEAGIALGHRRLAIIDISPLGHQPMLSASGRYVVVLNGEIYNFKDLRSELIREGYPFRGNSDTEVMLAAIETWGLESALQKFIGMFAFALWDRKERKLHLVRDRLGEKPLYYGCVGKLFLFGSELKALTALPGFSTRISRDALALYLRHNYVPAPYSIYEGIFKLLPGTVLTISPGDTGPDRCKPVTYWSARKAAEAGVMDPFTGSPSEAAEELDRLLQDAVSKQMVADVPLGAFLSGGIDSSTIVSLMQTRSSIPVKTFTIGFYEAGYNEAEHAKAVARHLGTDHTELYVTPQETMDVIPKLPVLYDEPFADSSQIPTFLVAQLARQRVTVSLSGDGGDELFGGYNRYFWGREIWHRIGWMPAGARSTLARALTVFSPNSWDRVFEVIGSFLPPRFKQTLPGYKIHKLVEILAVESPEAMYRGLVSHWKEPASVVPGSKEPNTFLTDRSRWANLPDFTQRMMFLDLISYLPDDILVKVDRACMGVSLESRVPFLDHRVVEFAWRLPLSIKVDKGKGKLILRRVLYRYVPEELIERPKMGFGVPIDSWLRGPLRDWAESLLSEKRLREDGFFNPEPIQEKWREHLAGTRNWQYYLWDILMFQAWLDEKKRFNGGYKGVMLMNLKEKILTR